jgi:hypothetical protein
MPKRFATIPIYNDSNGREVIPGNAVSVGTFDPLADIEDRKRRLDERERKLNSRDRDLDTRERRLDAYADSLAARDNEFKRNRLVADATRKMKALKRRMDALEEQEEQARSLPAFYEEDEGELDPPENPLLVLDEGELQAVKEPKPPDDVDNDNDGDDDDLDMGALPRSPLPPTSKRDPDTLHPSLVED